jgi:hypothetical protein
MADPWECRMGLDPKEPKDRNRFDLSRRYTNLEIYLQHLVRPDQDEFELHPPKRHRPGRHRGKRPDCGIRNQ